MGGIKFEVFNDVELSCWEDACFKACKHTTDMAGYREDMSYFRKIFRFVSCEWMLTLHTIQVNTRLKHHLSAKFQCL
ncbi:hypothetical protein EWB00_009393 [Schistosoma japonicum]|uniref:Uncharacterized protein n=1 Tax=Schistosoma japonicum TaxID=6182 RepID=A0A4Z2DRS8_SCHJA|nr:hypothetical protein KSF78_0003486 [Schistosoma japonicum]TNN19175.1 hypothetical protein EWB00_009393 [Schistosoma japonicum]